MSWTFFFAVQRWICRNMCWRTGSSSGMIKLAKVCFAECNLCLPYCCERITRTANWSSPIVKFANNRSLTFYLNCLAGPQATYTVIWWTEPNWTVCNQKVTHVLLNCVPAQLCTYHSREWTGQTATDCTGIKVLVSWDGGGLKLSRAPCIIHSAEPKPWTKLLILWCQLDSLYLWWRKRQELCCLVAINRICRGDEM